jgi:hypothetical protein
LVFLGRHRQVKCSRTKKLYIDINFAQTLSVVPESYKRYSSDWLRGTLIFEILLKLPRCPRNSLGTGDLGNLSVLGHIDGDQLMLGRIRKSRSGFNDKWTLMSLT